MPTEAFAAAKVNLFLHVGPPSDDGYHPICSLMAFADVGDRVSVVPADAPFFRVSGPFASELQGGGENLVERAAAALGRQARGPRAPLGLVLDKRLPVAAGLGGGSSDAGAALRLLDQAWGLGLAPEVLESVSASLGADGAACLAGRPVLAEGRGEVLSAAPRLPSVDAVLVNPLVAVSTPAVYRRLDEDRSFGDVTPPRLPEAFESAEELAGWLGGTRNDLQAPAVALAPEIGDVLETLAGEPETLFARMSGSGATCFALCAGDYEAETLAERLEALRPGWWVRRCRLGGPWSPQDARRG